jgi:hypothetical protein
MSEIRVDTISEKTSGSGTTVSNLKNPNSQFRNLIINGDMSIFQRATSTTTVTSGAYSTADRYKFYESTDGAYTTELENLSAADQATTGQRTALELNVTTADGTIGAAQFAAIYHTIEAQNLQHLLYGTSDAKDLTLSFYVKSNKTGTYSIFISKEDSTNYTIPIEYTISSADTWEKKVINISPTAGSTSLITGANGAIANDNGTGMIVSFNLAWGSNYHGTNNTWATAGAAYSTSNQVNWMDSTSNNFFLTGVQLEVGSTATDFEHLPFDVQLRRCQRYFYRTPDGGDSGVSAAYQHLGNGYMHASTNFIGHIVFPEVMRAAPTCSFDGEVQILDHSGARDPGSNISFESPTSRSVQPQATISGATQGHGAVIRLHNDSDGYIQADAEL